MATGDGANERAPRRATEAADWERNRRASWPARAFAWLVVRLRVLVVAAWVAAAVAATLLLPSITQAEFAPLGGLVPTESEAIETEERAAQQFEFPILSRTMVVQRDRDGLSREAVERAVQRAVRTNEQSERRDNEIVFAVPIVNVPQLFPSGREHGTTVVTYLFFTPATNPPTRNARAEEYAARIDQPDDALQGVTGVIPARIDQWEAIEGALPWVTGATIAVIALILGLTYRSPVAPLLVLFAAGIAYAVSTRVIAWVGEWTDVVMPREVEPVLVVLLLGIVTDYSVFYLSDFRRRLRAGEHRVAAAQRTAGQFTAIIFTAGLIVAAGTASLLAGTLEFFKAFGPGLALTVAVSVAVALTLVPALLALLGRAVYWPGLGEDEGRGAAGSTAGLRSRVARLTSARPVAATTVLLCAVGLTAAAAGLFRTDIALTPIRSLTAGAEAKHAAWSAAQGFAPGIVSPTELVLEGEALDDQVPALVRLQTLLEQHDAVAGVVGPREQPARVVPGAVLARDGRAARYLLVLEHEPYGSDALSAFDDLQAEMPGLLAQAGLPGVRASFAGDTAVAVETVDRILRDLARIAVVALAVNLVLLAVFLRALVAPFYLLASSALSLAATLGVTTFLFQTILGHDELTYYVPLAVGVLLVSLGSDYNVFLVGRIWQEARLRPLREAILVAAPRASGPINVAGLALALSFALLAIVPLAAFRQFAFAMAVGVLLEAFVVRTLLVPALIVLFGRTGWWPSRRSRRPPPAAEPAEVSARP